MGICNEKTGEFWWRESYRQQKLERICRYCGNLCDVSDRKCDYCGIDFKK